MTNEIAKQEVTAGMIEKVVIEGDLGKLNSEQRLEYYQAVCKSLGLNPLTKPFSYITLNNRLVLYANRDAAEQLRKINGVSITGLDKEWRDDLYIVTAQAADHSERTDTSTGVVNLAGLKGDNLANALMKAETKAKRRVTLSICGLGWLDETEVETIADAEVVDEETGEVIEPEIDWTLPEVIAHLHQQEHLKLVEIEEKNWEVKPPTAAQKKALYGLYRVVFSEFDTETQGDMIHALHLNVWGEESGKKLTGPQVSVMIDWLKSPDDWKPKMQSAKNAVAIACEELPIVFDEEQGEVEF